MLSCSPHQNASLTCNTEAFNFMLLPDTTQSFWHFHLAQCCDAICLPFVVLNLLRNSAFGEFLEQPLAMLFLHVPNQAEMLLHQMFDAATTAGPGPGCCSVSILQRLCTRVAQPGKCTACLQLGRHFVAHVDGSHRHLLLFVL